MLNSIGCFNNYYKRRLIRTIEQNYAILPDPRIMGIISKPILFHKGVTRVSWLHQTTNQIFNPTSPIVSYFPTSTETRQTFWSLLQILHDPHAEDSIAIEDYVLSNNPTILIPLLARFRNGTNRHALESRAVPLFSRVAYYKVESIAATLTLGTLGTL